MQKVIAYQRSMMNKTQKARAERVIERMLAHFPEHVFTFNPQITVGSMDSRDVTFFANSPDGVRTKLKIPIKYPYRDIEETFADYIILNAQRAVRGEPPLDI